MIGMGKLGAPCAEVMSTKYDVIGYDINHVETTVKMAASLKDAVKNRDIIFIAAPTPHDPEYDGRHPIADLPPKDFDYSIVQDILTEIDQHTNYNQLVVLISTVLPGTVRSKLEPLVTNARFVYNPYLIAMGSVKWDMVNPECLIIGTKDGKVTGDAKILIDFYHELMENNPKLNVGTWDEAEAIKIFYNSYISMKIGLVNMIQDVAEKNGNINVDVVTNALKNATQRITGPKYLTAGMGDGGACHPRDNIALRWMSQELDLGYDLFHSMMHSRDMQAKNKAKKLISLHKQYKLPIVIHGRAYKPSVSYVDGSYSELIAHFINEEDIDVIYVDPMTGDNPVIDFPAIFFMAHNFDVTYSAGSDVMDNKKYYCDIPEGSVILDPWRMTHNLTNVTVIQYGNTRIEHYAINEEQALKDKILQMRRMDGFIYR